MKTAIIIHGMPGKEGYFNPENDAESNCHWLPWIQRQLIVNGILAQTPEMPEPYTPNYEKWFSLFSQFKVDEQTDLIGHSCGAGFLLRWLSENKLSVGKLVLVAPWMDPDNELGDDNSFFDFEIDPELVQRTKGIYTFNSLDDDRAVHESVRNILEKLPKSNLIEMKNMGHFTFSSMRTREFPELATALLK
ncbi:MAG: alpha/beta hydrolase [Candidatus Nomurabacteria bacterium]|nr:alpha/beta hydrolase [Candidatus Nomurabacteria bacterium]USN87729.1 MAG: alpha/beta hydrolase [Candidatus Nomurabacteria bacterium]